MQLPDLKTYEKAGLVSALFILTGTALYLNLGNFPLFLEEPRRALIALEMYLSDNWTVPTQYGEVYLKKPPVWNWVILFSHTVFGDFSEWTVRFFGVLSFLFMGVITLWLGDKYVNFSFGLHCAFLVMTMADALFYLTVVSGEIDLFYSLITYSCIVLIFFLREKGEYGWMYFLGYTFSAIGLLTKGLPSVVFLGITLLVALWDGYKLKEIWSFGHLLGVLVFTAIVGWFAWSYQEYHEVSQYITTLWAESKDKTAVEGSSVIDFLIHLVTFPLETLKNILPAGILIIFAFRPGYYEVLRENRLIRFSFWVVGANILLYWLSPQTGSRYLYMLYPLLIIVLLYAYHTYEIADWRKKLFAICGYLMLSVCLIACAAYPFVAVRFDFPSATVPAIICSAFLVAILYVFHRFAQWRLLVLLSAFLFVRILFDFTVHEIRATNSPMLAEKEKSMQMAKVIGEEEVFLLEETPISRTIAFYTSRELGKIIRRTDDINHEGLYIVSEELLKGQKYEVQFWLPYKDEMTYLVRFD